MYSVYQHWDTLKTCIVGKSYPPEFYSYITNSRVRNVLERIAIETEEDYQKVIKLLQSFNVEVLRPEISSEFSLYYNNYYEKPPMTPRDYMAVIGNDLHIDNQKVLKLFFTDILKTNKKNFKRIIISGINSATTTRVGKDLYIGTNTLSNENIAFDRRAAKNKLDFINKKNFFPNNRCHMVDVEGHLDGVFCPVLPGLIFSINNVQNYNKTFPNWEVVFLPEQGWGAVEPFLKLKQKNNGKWWVPGEELNDDFTEFVEKWFTDWVGYVEETVFDVNMLVIDKNNVICNNYNKKVFDTFKRYNITPHVINFRHRYFWDGGLHCITQDLNREGVMEDYFPERGSESIMS